MTSAPKLAANVRITEIVVRHWPQEFRIIDHAHAVPIAYQTRRDGTFYTIDDLKRLQRPFHLSYVNALESQTANWLTGLKSQFAQSYIEITLTGHTSGEIHAQIRVDVGRIHKSHPIHQPEFQQTLIARYCTVLHT